MGICQSSRIPQTSRPRSAVRQQHEQQLAQLERRQQDRDSRQMSTALYFKFVYYKCPSTILDEIIKFVTPVDLLLIVARSHDRHKTECWQTAIKLLRKNLSFLFSLLYGEIPYGKNNPFMDSPIYKANREVKNKPIMDCLTPDVTFVSGSVLVNALLGEIPDAGNDIFIFKDVYCNIIYMTTISESDPEYPTLNRNRQIVACKDPIALVKGSFKHSIFRNTFDGKNLFVFDIDAFRQKKLHLDALRQKNPTINLSSIF